MTDTAIDLRTYSGETQSHQHDHHQFVFPHRGKLELEVDGRGGFVMAGLAVFIAAGSRHSFRSQGTNAFVVFDTREPADPRSVKPGPAFFSITPSTQGLLDYVTSTLPGRGLPEALRHAWMGLLLDSLTRDGAEVAGKTDRALSRATTFIREHAHHPFVLPTSPLRQV